MRLALAQMNSVVGDHDGNPRRIVERLEEAPSEGAQLVHFPELALTGYPPEDLVLKRGFLAANQAAVQRIASSAGEPLTVVGFVEPSEGKLYNFGVVELSAALTPVG